MNTARAFTGRAPDALVPVVDITDIEKDLFDSRGRLNILPSEYFHNLDRIKLLNFMHKHAIYVMPTTELIHWLKTMIIGDAIEIGAGNGAIARALGIAATDSYQQDDLDRKLLYALVGTPTVKYGDDVIKIDAEDAVDHYKPQTVIGAFITHKCWDFMLMVANCGNANGVEEQYIIKRAQRYIMIGNHHIHYNKPAFEFPHTTFYFPWIITRSTQPEFNCIYVWTKA